MLVAWTREWRHWGGRTDGIRRVNCKWDHAPSCHPELNKLNLNYSKCGGKAPNTGVGMSGPRGLSQKQVLPQAHCPKEMPFHQFSR